MLTLMIMVLKDGAAKPHEHNYKGMAEKALPPPTGGYCPPSRPSADMASDASVADLQPPEFEETFLLFTKYLF